jgi:hypothetical protein
MANKRSEGGTRNRDLFRSEVASVLADLGELTVDLGSSGADQPPAEPEGPEVTEAVGAELAVPAGQVSSEAAAGVEASNVPPPAHAGVSDGPSEGGDELLTDIESLPSFSPSYLPPFPPLADEHDQPAVTVPVGAAGLSGPAGPVGAAGQELGGVGGVKGEVWTVRAADGVEVGGFAGDSRPAGPEPPVPSAGGPAALTASEPVRFAPDEARPPDASATPGWRVRGPAGEQDEVGAGAHGGVVGELDGRGAGGSPGLVGDSAAAVEEPSFAEPFGVHGVALERLAAAAAGDAMAGEPEGPWTAGPPAVPEAEAEAAATGATAIGEPAGPAAVTGGETLPALGTPGAPAPDSWGRDPGASGDEHDAGSGAGGWTVGSDAGGWTAAADGSPPGSGMPTLELSGWDRVAPASQARAPSLSPAALSEPGRGAPAGSAAPLVPGGVPVLISSRPWTLAAAMQPLAPLSPPANRPSGPAHPEASPPEPARAPRRPTIPHVTMPRIRLPLLPTAMIGILAVIVVLLILQLTQH